jgi:hypothetical protein
MAGSGSVCPGFKNLPSELAFHLRKSATRTLNFSEIACVTKPAPSLRWSWRSGTYAVRSADDQTKHWYSEKRNVLKDFKNHIGEDIRFIDGLAIMTDTDNSGGEALSYYADIYFSEQ